jgi:hypothetical protein
LPWISVMVSGPLCKSASRAAKSVRPESGFLNAELRDLA